MKKVDLVTLGRVLRSDGKEGGLKLRLYHEGELPGFACSRLYLQKGGVREEFEVESLDLRRGRGFLKLKGIDSLSRADGYVGWEVLAGSDCFGPLPEGRFYEFELLGCRVVTAGGRELGTVAAIQPTAGDPLLVVSPGGGGKEFYIPFVDAICVRVDREKGEITVDPPEGLLELDEV